MSQKMNLIFFPCLDFLFFCDIFLKADLLKICKTVVTFKIVKKVFKDNFFEDFTHTAGN